MQKTVKEELIAVRENFGQVRTPHASRNKLLKYITEKNYEIKKGKSTLSGSDAEWLFDNFYLIEQALFEVGKSKRAEYERILPFTDIIAKKAEVCDKQILSMLFEVICQNSFMSEKEISKVRVACLYSVVFEIYQRLCIRKEIGTRVLMLRQIIELDFSPFVAGFSPAERHLRCDSAGVWQKMTRESRELYKEKISKMAKRQGVSFEKMCEIISARASEENRHIGEYIDFSAPSPIPFFIMLFSIFAVLVSLSFCLLFSPDTPFVSCLIVFLLTLPLFETSHRLSTFLLSLFQKSEILPSLELSRIEKENSTLVVIPALCGSEKDCKKLFSHLENLCLKARVEEGDSVYFALLVDFPESLNETEEEDGRILNCAKECTSALLEKYPDRFTLFWRKRVFDKINKIYTSSERKRGALISLARQLVRGKSELESFGADVGKIKYVITLDSDTDMGLFDIYKMVGTISHPLCRPVLSEDGTHVSKGFGILQPLTLPSLASAYSTPFSLLTSGAGGFDAYHGPAFDLHHVLYKRAMFCGKGIFDVEIYLKVLENAFPDGIVLSHDMLEGSRLRAGFLSDMAFYDSVPSNIVSYFRRAHRWARGDVQSLIFTTPHVFLKNGERIKNPQPVSDRFVFFVNFLSLISPVFSCLVLLCLTSYPSAAAFFLAISPMWIYSLTALIMSFVRFSFIGFYRRFFTEALTGIRREILHFLYSVCALFYRAFNNADAIIRALYRCAVSKKKCLEWSTADKEESRVVKKGTLAYYFLALSPSFFAGVFLLVFSLDTWVRAVGFLWCFLFIIGKASSKKRKKSAKIGDAEKKKIISYARQTWRYFEVCVNRENNFLPCDNISILPAFSVATRTSPTNIGLYLLSVVSARDFEFINSKEMLSRLEKTLETLERLPKFRGHLYNWYDTSNTQVLGREYISSVDSGNFAVCLVTLIKALCEVSGAENIRERFEKLLNGMDFKFLYNSSRKLFSLGYNVETEELEKGCYDLYMSEMRTTDYFAVASGIVPKEHWSALSRPLITRASLIGSASWSGTAFEYFMPCLFLPVFENSFADEALSFAFAEQVSFSKEGIFGISESGYFAFDRDMNYQYRAFGVPTLSLRREKEKEKVFSPYSVFLMMRENTPLCLKTLERYEKLGMWGDMGFFEALDYNPQRASGGRAMVKSYMAHHVGMSLVAMANVVFDDIFQKRFMSHSLMGSAVELLQEKIPTDAVILKKSVEREEEERVSRVFTFTDRETVCKNGERLAVCLLVGRGLSALMCDGGVLGLKHEDRELTRPVYQGMCQSFMPFVCYKKEVFPLIKKEGGRFLYTNSMAQYRSDAGDFSVNLSGDECALRIEVTGKKGKGDLIQKGFYFEPSFVSRRAFLSHPAYCDLFFETFFDEDNSALFIEYKGEKPFSACIMSEDGFEFEVSREKVFKSKQASLSALCDYIGGIGQFDSPKDFTPVSPCALVRSIGKSESAVFVLGFGDTRAEALMSASKEIKKSKHKSFSSSDSFASGLLRAAGVSGVDVKISEKLLSSFALCSIPKEVKDLPEFYSRSALWQVGISGDLPIVSVRAGVGEEVLEKIFIHHKYHYIAGCFYDLAVVCNDAGYEEGERNMCERLLDKTRCRFMENVNGGIFILRLDEMKMIETASSVEIKDKGDICATAPISSLPTPHRALIQGGGKNGFLPDGYEIFNGKETPPVLWHHIISAEAFGTLLSHRGLGHTWVYNAGLFRLTFWENDKMGGLGGEKLYLYRSGNVIDMCESAEKRVFRGGEAEFISSDYSVGVSIHSKCLYKQVRVKFNFDGEVKLFYSARFCISQSGDMGLVTAFKKTFRGALFSSPFSEYEKSGFAYLLAPFENAVGCQDGVWVEKSVKKGDECNFVLGFAGSEKHFEYVLRMFQSYEKTSLESRKYAEKFIPQPEKTGMGENVDALYNYFVPLQCAISRFVSRTGPYQSGGAWGARDQAQDALALIDTCSDKVRSHIFRICAHQFLEGDVLHWWHGFRGTRTRYSDDYLWQILLISEYVGKTGDESVLDVEVPYISSAELKDGERERYEKVSRSHVKEPVILHMKRALDLFVKRGVGVHGIPLMLGGDWNDGMNRVGDDGGESVWLGFFALCVFEKAFPLLEKRNIDTTLYREFCDTLYESIEKNAFFKDRYARAFLKDGSVLGAGEGEACTIDALPQAFASICYHITGRGNVARISAALDSAFRELYDEKNKIFKLFTPAFTKENERIGYVSRYPEGIRENGGQYTHAAVFSALSYLWAPSEKKKNFDRALKILECILPTERNPDIYLVEPYVISADIYSNPFHSGRGGWSFYTGSAGWCRYLIKEIMKQGE